MNGPANISRYILLKTSEPIEKPVMLDWFQCAKTYLPNGVLATVQTTDNKGALRSATMVHREVGGKHEYLIPLTRDLIDDEVQPSIDAFMERHPDLDFDIEVSSAQSDLLNKSRTVEVADNKFQELCNAWAKHQHDSWFKDRTESGWQYGPTMSLKNKTHPLLRQWHDLPDQFKKVDTTQPQALLDLLNDQGYSVIGKSELEGIMRLLKGGL